MVPTETGRDGISRRALSQFLGGIGVSALGGATLTALEGTINAARAQVQPGGVVPPLQAWVPNWPDMIEIWRQVSRSWRDLGLTIEGQQGDTSIWRVQIVGQHIMPHFAMMSWGGTPDRLDPDFFLTAILHSKRAIPGERNYGHFRDAEYDALVDAQRREMDEGKRQALVKAAQARAAALNPVFVLFFRDYIQAYNAARWDGVVPVIGSGIGMTYIPWSYMKMKPKTRRDILRVTSLYDVTSINPFSALGVMDQSILRWIYPTFTFRDPDTNVIPWVAESWNVVDPVTVDVKIREGMSWHDGHPLTVDDVKFTFDFVIANRFPGLAIVREAIDNVTVTGAWTVRFKLKEPFAPFISNVLGFAFVAPKHIWSQIADPVNHPNGECIGAGPFKHKEWRKGEYIRYEANKNFFVPPNIREVFTLIVPSLENQLGMMEQGTADMLGWYIDPKQAERLAAHRDLKVVSTATHGFHEIRLNMEMPPLDQPAIRQALQHAIDRQGLLNTVFGGAGTVANNTLISPAFKQWNNAAIEVPKFDIQLARKVLADAGYSWDTDGRLRFPSRL